MVRSLLVIVGLLMASASAAQERFITLASTTSTEQSGLFGHIVPLFRQQTGIDVRVIAVGTGQALALAARGDADAVLVHDPAGEQRFVHEGHGVGRREVMFNDFILVGPSADPAEIRGLRTARAALQRIASTEARFVSRGDDSGTHRLELRLWTDVEIRPDPSRWYRELGSGMGPTLNTAAAMGAYTLTDRATWAAFRNRLGMEVLVQEDPALINVYGSILVSPAKGTHIKAADAKIWHDWLTSGAGRTAIASFRIGGEQVFFPVEPAARLSTDPAVQRESERTDKERQ